MREACTILASQAFDLAILQVERSDHNLRVFKALQPHLPILLTAASAETVIPSFSKQQTMGILDIGQLAVQLPFYLAQLEPAQLEKTFEDQPASSGREPSENLVDEALLGAACQAINLESDYSAFFSTEGEIWPDPATYNENDHAILQAIEMASCDALGTDRIQYTFPKGNGESSLIYTRPVDKGYLTIVAPADFSVSHIRQRTESLAAQINQQMAGTREQKIRPPLRLPPTDGDHPAECLTGEAAAIELDEPPSLWMPPVSAVSQKVPWETFANAMAFVIPRLLFAALVLLAIIFFTYLGLDMASGTDFWPAVQEAVPNTIEYLQGLLQGDLGTTTTASGDVRPIPVTEVLAIWLPRSLGLLAISLLFASVVGLALGIRAATRGSAHSLGIIVATIIGVSVPGFFAAFLLQWAVINSTRLAGRTLLPVGGFGWDSHLILPVLVLAARPLAQITRITFVTIQDVLQQDYVRTARGKGLRNHQVMGRHVMRNAAIPILTTIGISLRFALSALPIVELYFGWLGGGFLLLKSIGQGDQELTIALVLCMGLIFIVVNFLLEVSYQFIDPRLRTQPAHITSGASRKPSEVLRSAAAGLGDLISNNPLANWIKERSRPPVESPFRVALERGGIMIGADDNFVPSRGRSLRRALGNLPLLVGAVLMLLLLIVFLFGPNLAPNSPFTTEGLLEIDGQLTPPPFAPSARFPWGTDALGRGIMSLILAGARQTLLLAALAVAARMFVGVILGTIAGWINGSRLDRLIVGAAEIIAAYPALLLAMIIILAIGIREGLMPFIIALTIVGWGETMQYVRSEVMGIRPKPFIESAIAIGANTPRIIGRHILPILFSSLISIAALEMGSVLMLLGELGFISIFIGGGSLIELSTQTLLYSDVPEWGALLSNVRLYVHGYPWTALYPMLALFIAVLAFNLFGEGIRRLVAEGHLVINRFINRYTISFAIVAVVGLLWLRQNMGAMPFYKQFAAEFDGQRAMAYVTQLTDPVMEGRNLGTDGMDRAAGYIAEEMVRLGLQAGGQKNTLFQERKRAFESFDAYPVLNIDDGGPAPEYGLDYSVYPSQSPSLGESAAQVHFVGLGKLSPYKATAWRPMYPELDRADFSENIVLTLSDREAEILDYRVDGGMLVVTDDPEKLGRRYTVGGVGWGHDSPRLWISEELAERLVSSSGYTLEELREQVDALPPEALLDIPLEMTASANVTGKLEDGLPVRNVIGLLPGTSGKERCTICLGEQLIVVMAQYDSPPIGPDGEAYEAANDNASGVAVMLEALRVIQETDYQPYRSFLFIAYSGEGLDGGAFVNDPDVNRFLQAKTGFTEFLLEAIIQVRGVGGGSGDRLQVSSGGSLRLADLFEASARQMGVRTVRSDEAIDLGLVFEDTASGGEGVQKAPVARLHWEGWDEHARLQSDTLENMSAENLEDTGRALAMALMVLGREQNY